jgi:hypothetical protein
VVSVTNRAGPALIAKGDTEINITEVALEHETLATE